MFNLATRGQEEVELATVSVERRPRYVTGWKGTHVNFNSNQADSGAIGWRVEAARDRVLSTKGRLDQSRHDAPSNWHFVATDGNTVVVTKRSKGQLNGGNKVEYQSSHQSITSECFTEGIPIETMRESRS
jgi:hypothetical protein